MTERRMTELAAQARERHKDDPAFVDLIPGIAGKGKAIVATPSEAFWYWWGSWIEVKASQYPERSLSYKGRDDPNANTAIGSAMKKMKGVH